MSDEISFKMTSYPVTQIMNQQKHLAVTLFPENVYRFKPDALNHHELKEFTAACPFGSSIFVSDGKASKIWLMGRPARRASN